MSKLTRPRPTLRAQSIRAPDGAVAYYYDDNEELQFIVPLPGQADFVAIQNTLRNSKIDPGSIVTLRGFR